MWRTIATERMQRFPPKCQHFMTFPAIISIRSFRGVFFLQFLESPETLRFQLVLLTSWSKDYQSLRHINMPCESVYLRLQSRLGISQVEISSGVCCSGLGRQKKGDWSSMNITGQPPPFPAPPASDVHYRRYMTCVGEEEREGRGDGVAFVQNWNQYCSLRVRSVYTQNRKPGSSCWETWRGKVWDYPQSLQSLHTLQ